MLYYTSSSEHTRKLKSYIHMTLILSIFLQFCVSLPPVKLISTPPPPRSSELLLSLFSFFGSTQCSTKNATSKVKSKEKVLKSNSDLNILESALNGTGETGVCRSPHLF